MLVAALPSEDAAVTLSRADLAAWLCEPETPAVDPDRDLTVEEVAEKTGRAPSTVRGWLGTGQLRGYKFNERDWRITRSAMREFLDGQRQAGQGPSDDDTPVDIADWRKHSE